MILTNAFHMTIWQKNWPFTNKKWKKMNIKAYETFCILMWWIILINVFYVQDWQNFDLSPKNVNIRAYGTIDFFVTKKLPNDNIVSNSLQNFLFFSQKKTSLFFFEEWRVPKSRDETHLRVSQSQVAESRNLKVRS